MYHFNNKWSLKWRIGASLQKLSNTYKLVTKIQWGTDPAILILCFHQKDNQYSTDLH